MQMKNKLKKTMIALCAALILMGGFSVPAYAQGAATEPNAGDATNDSNVVVEEKEETPPLTPKGNATLVDDYGGNKQLITVTTKSGNCFYILIDRAAEGEQTVHFLNQVDEAQGKAGWEQKSRPPQSAGRAAMMASSSSTSPRPRLLMWDWADSSPMSTLALDCSRARSNSAWVTPNTIPISFPGKCCANARAPS